MQYPVRDWSILDIGQQMAANPIRAIMADGTEHEGFLLHTPRGFLVLNDDTKRLIGMVPLDRSIPYATIDAEGLIYLPDGLQVGRVDGNTPIG